MTMPKHHNVTLVNSAAFTVLIRTSIAYSYALGSQMMVPWDIYLPTPHAARYYGLKSQFSDLYEFVRTRAVLLDATIVPKPAWNASTNERGENSSAYNLRLPIGTAGRLASDGASHSHLPGRLSWTQN